MSLKQVTLPISGMTCAACVMHVEGGLKEVPGVENATVNLANERAMVQFDPVSEIMRVGTYLGNYKVIPCNKTTNVAPIVPVETKTEVAVQSTIKIDELMVWSTAKDLQDYHMSTRGRAGYLDLR